MSAVTLGPLALDRTEYVEDGLFDVHYKLNGRLPKGWISAFNEAWAGQWWYAMKRQVRIVGDRHDAGGGEDYTPRAFGGAHLVVTCPVDEIAEHHLPRIKLAIEEANKITAKAAVDAHRADVAKAEALAEAKRALQRGQR